MSPSLSAWSRVLLIALSLVCAFVVVVIAFAAGVIVVDESRHDDSWDGFGTFIGVLLGGFATAVLHALVALWLLTWFGRSRHDRRRLAWAGVLSAGFALLFLGWMLQMLLGYVAQSDLLLPVIGLPALAVAMPAVATLVEAVKTPEPAPGSRL